MKRITAIALSMMALLFVSAGYAQEIQATVPFEFSAGDTTFPAGEYRLSVGANHVLTLSNHDTGSAAFTMTAYPISASTNNKSALEFKFQDGQAVLSEVRIVNGGYALHVPKRPRVLAQNTAAAIERQ
jgi:hypothetical protein